MLKFNKDLFFLSKIIRHDLLTTQGPFEMLCFLF